jgi:hypothetical protein
MNYKFKSPSLFAGCWLLTPVILATQEAEIRRTTGQSQTGQIVLQDPILKNPLQKNKAGGVAQGKGPEFMAQYHTHTHTKSFC